MPESIDEVRRRLRHDQEVREQNERHDREIRKQRQIDERHHRERLRAIEKNSKTDPVYQAEQFAPPPLRGAKSVHMTPRKGHGFRIFLILIVILIGIAYLIGHSYADPAPMKPEKITERPSPVPVSAADRPLVDESTAKPTQRHKARIYPKCSSTVTDNCRQG